MQGSFPSVIYRQHFLWAIFPFGYWNATQLATAFTYKLSNSSDNFVQMTGANEYFPALLVCAYLFNWWLLSFVPLWAATSTSGALFISSDSSPPRRHSSGRHTPLCRCSASGPNWLLSTVGCKSTEDPQRRLDGIISAKWTYINSSLSSLSLFSAAGAVMEADWPPFGVRACQLTALWGHHLIEQHSCFKDRRSCYFYLTLKRIL